MKCLRGGYHKRSEFNDWFESNGESSLVYRVLEECPNDDDTKNKLEIKYFKQYSPIFYGQTPSLNNTFGQSLDTKSRISESLKKYNAARGAYVEKVCECGNVFSTLLCETLIYCSKKCSNYGLSAKLDIDVVKDLYFSGMTMSQVADELGVHHRTIHHFMVKNNIPRRPQGTRGK